MSAVSPEPSLSGLTLSGSANTPTASTPTISEPKTAFNLPTCSSYPPFYTIQPNLITRARQLELWSDLITSYCAHHRIFKLSLSSLPADLFHNTSIKRSLKPADIKTVLDFMSKPENGPRTEWITPTTRTEQSASCYVYWRTPSEWADAIYSWVDETGQKGTVLTIYEIREGDAVRNRDWRDADETLLRKILNVLVKRGKAQIFGQEENAGVKPAAGKKASRAKSRSKHKGEEPLTEGKGVRKASNKTKKPERPAKAVASVYDAVAGRVGPYGFIADREGGLPLKPEEALFQHAGAPVRYEEDDPYWQDRYLPKDVRLPESDLLKAIHAYVSDYYGSGETGDARDDFYSLDETALMAMGILLEEAAHFALERSVDNSPSERLERMSAST